ncbi:helix-turn-helix domain-containing protein [Curtobacterium sp. YC1]|uniref:helix-turn-helix domain-containing transcriptional regulator n=1 Tax=Curtobacterium sp. YC1 TaxID=2795488 RepID=UPI0018E5A3A0|nr:helix-turn-helix domain-containing protein [Curtobacterium sp. YC1]QQD76284.1 helix-turn-helix domain-containing protein [Curtobacterium sp. YC1]
MTGAFWDNLAEEMQDPEFARMYAADTIRIRTIDAIVNVLRDAATAEGVTREQIAKATGKQAAAVRRLLSADTVNPTVTTVAEVAAALGYRITLQKMAPEERAEITDPMRAAAAA